MATGKGGALKRCAFLTMEDRGDFVIDDDLALQPMAELGWDSSVLSWRQTEIPWSQFDAVIIRSTWDYYADVDGFLDVLQRIDQESRLANSIGLVRWNLAKTYLRDLQFRKVPIVRTLWRNRPDSQMLQSCFSQMQTDELVIKPVVGANGADTFRLSRNAKATEFERIANTFSSRAVMIQPFMPQILAEGEYSLFYFNGRYSHAILKVPAAGEFRSQEEHGSQIRSVDPEPLLRSRVEQAVETLNPAPLYVRVDMVRDAENDFRVMELELIEPSLYLRTEVGAPARFAAAINSWFKNSLA